MACFVTVTIVAAVTVSVPVPDENLVAILHTQLHELSIHCAFDSVIAASLYVQSTKQLQKANAMQAWSESDLTMLLRSYSNACLPIAEAEAEAAHQLFT